MQCAHRETTSGTLVKRDLLLSLLENSLALLLEEVVLDYLLCFRGKAPELHENYLKAVNG